MAVSPSPNHSSPTPGSRVTGREGSPIVRGKYPGFLLPGVVLICVGVIGCLGYFIFYPQLGSTYYWRKAQAALSDDDLAEARQALTRSLACWPGNGEAQFTLARVCRRAGDFEAARVHLQEAQRLQWPPPLIELENLLLQAQCGLVQPIETTLRRYLVSQPEQETAILEALVIGNLQTNSLNEAHRWATSWTERHPQEWRAFLWQGKVYEHGLRYDLAADAYEQALKLQPSCWEAHLRSGEVLLRRGRYTEALPHLEAFVQHEPAHADGLLALARCQRSLQPPEVARATLDRLLAGNPDCPSGLLLYGQLELECDHPAEALVWLHKAEAVLPEDRELNHALATALHRLNRHQEAEGYERKKQQIDRDLHRMDEITRAVVAHPQNVALRREAGTILLRLGEEQEASRWLLSAFLLDRTDQTTKKALLDCLRKLDDPKLTAYYRPILEDSR